MGGLVQAIHLFPLQFNVAVNGAVSEDAACLQEFSISIECIQRFAQAACDGRYTCEFLGRQFVQIFVESLAGVQLVLNAIKASHQHGSKGEVRVAGAVREANFYPVSFRVAALHIGDANGC